PNGVVLFFYPKANTPGCTKESIGFSEAQAEFKALGYDIVGISKDPVKAQDKFVEKQSLTVPLLSDEYGTVSEDFGVWKEKSMYGKTYMGIERSTFLINGEGQVVREWRKVKVPGHVEAVLEAIKEL
ncbi:MAG: peroxiredoxin, partial [Rhodobacteraceae bacterium]|nr:peroxiredoxin [Paracoccaceae bacterium]